MNAHIERTKPLTRDCKVCVCENGHPLAQGVIVHIEPARSSNGYDNLSIQVVASRSQELNIGDVVDYYFAEKSWRLPFRSAPGQPLVLNFGHRYEIDHVLPSRSSL